MLVACGAPDEPPPRTTTTTTTAVAPTTTSLAPTPSAIPAKPAKPATFVGTATCAPCHAAQTALARLAPRPRHASRRAATVLGDFRGRTLRSTTASRPTFSQRDGKLRRPHRRTRRQARPTIEVTYTFGVDPLQQYLRGAAGRPLQALGDRLGHTTARRAASVGSTSTRTSACRPRGPAALDRPSPELEPHVRRVPLDERAQGLRRRDATATTPRGRS